VESIIFLSEAGGVKIAKLVKRALHGKGRNAEFPLQRKKHMDPLKDPRDLLEFDTVDLPWP